MALPIEDTILLQKFDRISRIYYFGLLHFEYVENINTSIGGTMKNEIVSCWHCMQINIFDFVFIRLFVSSLFVYLSAFILRQRLRVYISRIHT